jgi:Protein of unknown function VcgC/VcgE (DUF2780)
MNLSLETTMSDVISELAAKSGLSPEQAKKGLGAILSFLKASVPEETFAKVSSAVPDSDQMMAAAGPHEEPSGGIVGAIKGVADKLFGGGCRRRVARQAVEPRDLRGAGAGLPPPRAGVPQGQAPGVRHEADQRPVPDAAGGAGLT